MGTEPQINWKIMVQFKYWEFSSYTWHSALQFFDTSTKHIPKYLMVYKVLIKQNTKITFTFDD
jgi:hypothetical protein